LGTHDGHVRLIDTATNQLIVDGTLLTHAGGFYGNSYWTTTGNSYVSGVFFSMGSISYITGLPAGNYRLETSTPGLTGYGSGNSPYYEIHDWSSWDAMDYYITVL
jgi:hypothetical protein